MKVLGIYCSPRKGGNSDILLNEALRGAQSVGAEMIDPVRCCDPSVKINGCLECGGCDKTGTCVVDDDMQLIYPRLLAADIIILATPIFFYGVPSQGKALIDRCQALWSKRMLEKTPEQRRRYDSGRGYMIAVGATKGANLFVGMELTAKYFYDALDMSYEGGVLVKQIESKGDIAKYPEYLEKAFELGRGATG
ncbi:MAG: flavodoxin family protein [Thermodesulfobacteriota bacterium]